VESAAAQRWISEEGVVVGAPWSFGDVVAMVVALVLSPLALAVGMALVPLCVVARCFLLAVPAMVLFLAYASVVFAISHLLCSPFGLLDVERSRRNLQTLRLFANVDVFEWRDFLALVRGRCWRLPLSLAVAPVVKYVFVANPWLSELAVRFANEWTDPRDLDTKRKRVKLDRARYPPAPRSREPSRLSFKERDLQLPLSVGVEFHSIIQFVSCACPPESVWDDSEDAVIPVSNTGDFFAVGLLLSYWNPLHALVGYAEVNVRSDFSLEHPTWCAVGETKLAHLCYRLFARIFPTNHRRRANDDSLLVARRHHHHQKHHHHAWGAAENTKNESIVVFDETPSQVEGGASSRFEPYGVYLDDRKDDDDFSEEDDDDEDDDAAAVIVSSSQGKKRVDERHPPHFEEEEEEEEEKSPIKILDVDFDEEDDRDEEVLVVRSAEFEFNELFYTRKIGFSVSLSSDKRRGTSHVTVDEVYATCAANEPLHVGDELTHVNGAEPLSDPSAPESDQLVAFLALIDHIRHGERPITILFRRTENSLSEVRPSSRRSSKSNKRNTDNWL